MTKSGWSLSFSFSTCSSCSEMSRSGSRYAARVARPRGGKSEYLIGRQYGLVASVNAGRINLIFLSDRLLFKAASSLRTRAQYLNLKPGLLVQGTVFVTNHCVGYPLTFTN